LAHAADMSIAEKRLRMWVRQEPDIPHVLFLLVANGNTLYIDLHNDSLSITPTAVAFKCYCFLFRWVEIIIVITCCVSYTIYGDYFNT
jgi:hypothetical protein